MRHQVISPSIVHHRIVSGPHFVSLKGNAHGQAMPRAMQPGTGIGVALAVSAALWAGIALIAF